MNDSGPPRTEADGDPGEEAGPERDHGQAASGDDERVPDPVGAQPVIVIEPGGDGDDHEKETTAGDIDQQTLLWAIAGDDAAFARLIQHYDAGLCELVFAQVGDAKLMDRVLASTYRKAYRALPRLRNATKPGAWLSGLAAKACAEELRRQSQRNRSANRAALKEPATGRQRVDVSGRVDPVAAGEAPPNPTLRPKPVELPVSAYGPSAHDEAEGDERVTLIAAEADDVDIDLSRPAATDDADTDDAADVEDDDAADVEDDDAADVEDDDAVDVALDLGTEQLTLPGTPPAHLPGFWNRLGRQLIAEREIPARPAPTVDQIRAAREATNAETAEEVSSGRGGRLATPDRLVRFETPVTVEELAHRAGASSSRLGQRIRQVAVVLLAVVAVSSVVFVAFRIGGNAKQLNRAEMSNRVLVKRVTDTLGSSRTVAATFTEVTTEGGLKSTTSQLFFARNGSFRLRTVDGSVDVAYDASTGTRSLRSNVGGLQQVEQKGLATGAPDPHDAINPFFDADLGLVLTALRARPDTFVPTQKAKGRTVWHAEVDLAHDSASPDRAILEVDQDLLVPTKVELRRGDQIVRVYELANVVLDQGVPANTFAFPFTNDPVDSTDDGFVRSTLSDIPAQLGGFQPATPKFLPDGYELAEVAVHPGEGATTGPGGTNPPSKDVVSLTYRRGWESITLTTRANNIAPGATWSDPFVATGPAPPADSVRISGGRFNGTEARRVSPVGRPPYLWGATDSLLFTITGDLTPDDLVRVVASVQ